MGARALRRLVIVIVAVLALLVAADRVGVFVAERAAGDTIQSSQHLDSRPDVDIAGFPFLTQLATGKYDKITVTAEDVPVGGKKELLEISRLQVVLHTLRVSRDFSSVRADRADATALITYAELGNAVGINVSYAGGGRIKAAKTVSVGGTSVTAVITTKPQLSGHSLSFGSSSVRNAGQLGDAALSTLDAVFDLSIPLGTIPFQVRVDSLHADEHGIEVALTGHNLYYAS